jgi:hypothetical protein
LTPRIFLPPSIPRSKQLGAERQDRLSITTALGSGASPQARRQVRRRVAGLRCRSPAPSEPDGTIARHPAQASAALYAARKVRLRLRHALPSLVTPVGPFDAKHRLTSPTAVAAPSLRFRRDPSEVCTLSGWVFPTLAGPICPITGQRSLSPTLLYPLHHPPSLRSGYRLAAGRMGLTLLSNVEMRMGRLRPVVRRVTVPPSSTATIDEPTRLPFWPRPVSTFGRFSMTDLNHGRSLAFSLPSSAGPRPDWCFQSKAVVPGASHVGLLRRMSG